MEHPTVENVIKGYGGHGYGDGLGLGGGGLLGGLVVGSLLNGGWGGRRDGADAAVVIANQTTQLMQTSATETASINATTANATTQLGQRIDSLGGNLSNLIGQTSAQTQNRLDNLNSGMVQGFAATNAALCNQRYESAQQTNSVQAQIAALGASLSAQLCASTQSIKDQATSFRMADLERQLAVAQVGGERVQLGGWVPFNPCPAK